MNDMPMDLGYKMGGEMAGPIKMSDKMYPQLHLEWPSEYDLPDAGEMTVTFKKVGENKSKRDGKMRYTVDLEIRTIESVEESDEQESADESGAEALDRYHAEAQEGD
jgi:hypothetical protein